MRRGAVSWLRNARRFGARGLPLGAALFALFAGVFVVLGYMTLASTGLSPRQVGDKEFGTFASFAGFGLEEMTPGDDRLARELYRSVASLHLQQATVAVIAPDFYVHGGPVPKMRFEERDWAENPFPNRYSLVVGRWPRAPGEIALSEQPASLLNKYLQSPDDVVAFKIVGVVQDAYATQPAVLAPRGSWRTLRSSLSDQFITMRAQPVVYWAGGRDDQVLQTIEETIARYRLARGGDEDRASLRDEVGGSYGQRPRETDGRRFTWLDRVPAGYNLPSVLLPVLTTTAGFSIVARRIARLRLVSRSLGLPSSTLVVSFAIRLIPIFVFAALVGCIIGWRLGHVGRPVLEHFAKRPVDLDVPWFSAAQTVAVVTCVTALVLVAVAGAWDWSKRDSVSRVRRPSWRLRQTLPEGEPKQRHYRSGLASTRRLAALGGLCFTVLQLPRVDTPGRATAASIGTLIAGLLMFPDIGSAGLRFLSRGGWRTRLVARRLGASGARSTVSVTLVAIVTGLAFGYLVLLETWLASADAERLPEVMPGQVLVTDRSSPVFPPQARVADAVSHVLPRNEPIHLRWTLATDGAEKVTAEARLAGGLSHALVVTDSIQASKLLGRELSAPEARFLDSGGSLAWVGGEVKIREGQITRRTFEVVDGEGSVVDRTTPISMLGIKVQLSGWQAGSFGLITRSTAASLQIPQSDGALLYSSVSASEVAGVRLRLSSTSIDPDTVVTYAAPAPLIPAGALPVIALLLGALALVLSLSATWIDARQLRSFSSLLTCVGVPARAARRVLVLQQGCIFGAGWILGLTLALPPILILIFSLPEYNLNIPWSEGLTLAGSCVVAWGLSLATMLVRLRYSGTSLSVALADRQ